MRRGAGAAIVAPAMQEAPPPAGAPVTWVVSDGKIGMENQCLGLAAALGVAPVVKRLRIRAPWRWLPPQAWVSPLSAPDPAGDTLAPPWPDLLIATGRQTVASALAIKRASPATVCVQIQNPTIGLDRFDLVVVPQHDRVRGDNILVTEGALHGVTKARLEAAAATAREGVDHLPRPRIAVLLGGDNKVFRVTSAVADRLGRDLATLAREHGASLLITASRRTSAEALAAIRQHLADLPVVVWAGEGPNPYLAWLGLADVVVATEDSVNMVTEAATTGRPIYVAALEGGSAKFARFHQAMREAGITRPFDGTLEAWSYTPPDDTRRVADEVRRRMVRTLEAAAE